MIFNFLKKRGGGLFGEVFRNIHGTVVCDEFAWFSNSDEYYIIHLESGMMVNWYKHLGRTNTCSQKDRTIDDYYEFFRLFKEELDYFERRN